MRSWTTASRTGPGRSPARAGAPGRTWSSTGSAAQLGAAAFETIASGGRFSAHGAASGGFAAVGADQAARRGVTLRGIEQVQFGPGEHERLAGQALAALAAGRLRPFVGQVFPLPQAAAAHQALETRSAVGKTLLTVA